MRESFSENEKEILRRISNKETKYVFLNNIIDSWLSDVNIIIDTNAKSVNIYFAKEMLTDDIVKKLDEIENFIVETINIIDFFKNEGYILIYQGARQNSKYTMGQLPVNIELTPMQLQDEALIELIIKYCKNQIFHTPALNEFIKDGFITKEEKRFRKNYHLTILAIICTFSIGIAGIILNIIFLMKKF